MTNALRVSILALAACNASFAAATPAPIAVAARGRHPDYNAVVRKVAAMPEDARAQGMASRAGLEILNLLWEDTGRWQGSSLGPNISDVTIEVEMSDGRGHKQTALMPVLRHPNFTDKTGDVGLATAIYS